MDFGYDEQGNRTTEHKDHERSSETNKKNLAKVRARERNANTNIYENDFNNDRNVYET